MKLNEFLKSKGLTEEDIKTVNTDYVDALISAKVGSKDEEITKLTGELEATKGELTPFKQEKRTKHISSLVSDLTTEDKLADALALAGISDEDDDETIKAKVSKTIETRAYLQKDAGTPVEIVDKKLKETKEKSKEYKFVKN